MGMTLSLTRNVLDTHLGWHAAGPARPARIGAVPLRQHGGRRPLQRLGRPAADQRVAALRLVECRRDDEDGHARGLHPRRVRHLEPRLPDVPGGDAQLRSAGSTRPSATAAPTPRCASSRPSSTRAPGIRQDPPWPRVEWSQRNNNNYQQTGLLVSLAFAAENRAQLLSNFYAKAKARDRQAAARGTVRLGLPGRRPPARGAGRAPARARQAACRDLAHLAAVHGPSARRAVPGADADGQRRRRTATPPRLRAAPPSPSAARAPASGRLLPAGSYVVRMDQPLQPGRRRAPRPSVLEPRRSAEAIPTTTPAGASASSSTSRRCASSTAQILAAPMSLVTRRSPRRRASAARARSTWWRTTARTRCCRCATRWTTLRTEDQLRREGRSRRRRRSAPMARDFPPRQLDRHRRRPRASWERSRPGSASPSSPPSTVPRSPRVPSPAPRLALLHSWLNTQTEGWWRQRLDLLGVPYDYISTQDVAATPDLAREVRRHPLSAGRRRRTAAHRHRSADVRRAAALADDPGDAESRQDRRHRRPASGARFRGPRAPAAVRRGRRTPGRGRGHRGVC